MVQVNTVRTLIEIVEILSGDPNCTGRTHDVDELEDEGGQIVAPEQPTLQVKCPSAFSLTEDDSSSFTLWTVSGLGSRPVKPFVRKPFSIRFD